MLRDAFWDLSADIGAEQQGADVAGALAGSERSFLDQYRAWNAAGGLAALRTDADLARMLRVTLGTERDRRRAAGDATGAAELAPAIESADQLQADLRAALDSAEAYAGTWDALGAWLTALLGGVGLAAFPLIPLGLTAAAAVTAVAALGYVVTTWDTARGKVGLLTDLTNRLQAGTLTTEQAQTITAALQEPAGLFSGLGGVALVALAAAAVWFLRK